MNWVGGVRNRLKTRDEKRRQKEFFEKMRYGSKVRRLSRSGSPQKMQFPTSLDLVSLQAADFSAMKFKKNDADKSLKSKVKKVELDRSRGLFPLHHHHDDLELPMSPGAPSKLQLQEPDERGQVQVPWANSTFTSSSAEKLEHAMHGMKTEEISKTPCSDQRVQTSQSSLFHSTPMTGVLANAPLHQPLKHQGKHFEDLFFSFVPKSNDAQSPKQDFPFELSAVSDDEKLSEDFGYSPLSSISSESSSASSLTMQSQDYLPNSQGTISSTASTTSQQVKGLQKKRLVSSSMDLTQNATPSRRIKTRHPNADTLPDECSPEQDHYSESYHPQKTQEEFELTLQQADLICKEEDSFLSPFGKRAGIIPSTSTESRKVCQNVVVADARMPEKPRDVICLSGSTHSLNSGTSPKEQNSLKKEITHTENPIISPQSKANSFKWKAFVSGHDATENSSNEQKERTGRKTPRKPMSKVCEQVLKEVLQLDSELCTNSPLLPGSTSKTGSLASMMDFINFPMKQNRDEMEGFSIPVTKEQTRDEHLDNKQHAKQTTDQQKADPNQQDTKTTPFSELQSHQLSNTQQEDKKANLWLQGSITMEEESPDKEEVKDIARDLNVSTDDTHCDLKRCPHPETQRDDSVADGTTVDGNLGSGNSQILLKSPEPKAIMHNPLHNTSLPVRDSRGIMHEEKETQCNMFQTVPTEDKEIQCTIEESANATSMCGNAEQLWVTECSTIESNNRFDAYDQCILT